MLLKIISIIFIFLNLLFCCIASDENAKLKPCKTDLVSEQCPPNTSCTSLQQQNTAGFCKCFDKYTFNVNFTKDEEYCIASTTITTASTIVATSSTSKSTVSTTTLSRTTIKVKPPTIKTTTIKLIVTTPLPTSSSTKAAPIPQTTTLLTSTPSNNEDGVQMKKVHVETEHLLGGIMLPFMIVVLFIGGVYFIRKHNLLERAHNYLTERNWRLPGAARPNYNDFDEFDDPLLI